MKYRQPPEKSRPSLHQRPQNQQQRSSLWVGLILFISAWVFLLGVLVGRKSAPVLLDYRKINTEIADLAKRASNNKQALKQGESDPLAALDGLDFYKKLKEKTQDIPELQLPLPEKPAQVADAMKPLARKPESNSSAGNMSGKPPENVRNPETAAADVQQPEAPPITQEAVKDEAPIEHKPEKPVERKPETLVERKPEAPPHPPLQRARQPEAPFERKPDTTVHTAATTQALPVQAHELPAEHKPKQVDHPVEAAKTEPQKIRSAYDLMKPQPAKEVAVTSESHSPESIQARPVAAEVKQPVKPPQSEKKVTLQIPSLTDRKSADDQVELLRKKGIHAWKVATMVPGKGVWYRVVVGKYGVSEADTVKNRLKQDNVDVSAGNP
jgi:hypothetical protein